MLVSGCKVKRFLSPSATLVLSALLLLQSAHADNEGYGSRPDAKARLSSSSSGTLKSVTFSPVNLKGGSQLTLVSPSIWSPLADQVSTILGEVHSNYTALFGDIPPFNVSVQLMDEETFYVTTGAPRWTNAMFYKGQVIIPLSLDGKIDMENMFRSLKHEYTHALIHALSGGKCPGWLDEGMAQWAEGSENPALEPALRRWLVDNEPVPLKLLQGGFTKLESSLVPASYAESYFAANAVMNTFGFKVIRGYLDSLKKGEATAVAFQKNFGITEEIFEGRLGVNLKRWAIAAPHKEKLD